MSLTKAGTDAVRASLRGPVSPSAPHNPVRLDEALVGQRLVTSRSKAQRLIKAGFVSVNGHASTKPATPVSAADSIDVADDERYVSRGAYKLAAAFGMFAPRGLPSPQGLACLDVGASTGGFCDVLLRAGASQVIALDVGHGQLDPRIRSDPHVIEMSGVNIRGVQVSDLPYRPQLIVSDVSFISLRHVIPVVERIAAAGAHIVLLVKPQFEVGKGRLGRNGVVGDPKMREQALRDVTLCARQHGLTVVDAGPSPIEGMAGNKEYLLYARLSEKGAEPLKSTSDTDELRSRTNSAL